MQTSFQQHAELLTRRMHHGKHFLYRSHVRHYVIAHYFVQEQPLHCLPFRLYVANRLAMVKLLSQ